MEALGELQEAVGIASLVKIARTHPRADMREEAIDVLGDLGEEEPRARRALQLLASGSGVAGLAAIEKVKPKCREVVVVERSAAARERLPEVLEDLGFEHLRVVADFDRGIRAQAWRLVSSAPTPARRRISMSTAPRPRTGISIALCRTWTTALAEPLAGP